MLANAAGDQLRKLRAEIEDQNSIQLTRGNAHLSALTRRAPLADSQLTSLCSVVVKTGIPSGLQSLLGKLGLNVGQGAEKADGKLAQKGLTGQTKEAKGLEKGAVIGDGKVLAGLGHTPHDKRTGERNLVEQANIDRFLQDPQVPQDTKEQPATQKQADASERNQDAREAREGREVREEVRREEKTDDARAQAHGDKKQLEEQKEARENKEHERERERQRDEREKDDEKKRQAYVEEQLEREEETKNGKGLRSDDVMGAHSRCRGHADDGTRCLRKPMQGAPYCREHLHT